MNCYRVGDVTTSRIKPEQKHTPTPWDAEGATIYGDDLWVAACQSSAGSVQEEINAAFIVLACNAHDDLVAALKGMLLSADATWEERNEGHDWREACERARAALAKVGRKG